MKRLLILLTGLSLGYSAAAVAQDSTDFTVKTSRHLVNLCSVTAGQDDYEAAMGYCLGFMDGVHDYHAVLTSDALLKPVACPGHQTTRGEFVSMFLDWAAANPSLLDNESPIQGVMRAAAQKWPCQSHGRN
jgi:hypothetical protein